MIYCQLKIVNCKKQDFDPIFGGPNEEGCKLLMYFCTQYHRILKHYKSSKFLVTQTIGALKYGSKPQNPLKVGDCYQLLKATIIFKFTDINNNIQFYLKFKFKVALITCQLYSSLMFPKKRILTLIGGKMKFFSIHRMESFLISLNSPSL